MKNRNRLLGSFAILASVVLYGAGWFHGHYFEFVWPLGNSPSLEKSVGSNHFGDANDQAGHDHGQGGGRGGAA